jgi:hypothetical protein
MGLLTYEKRGKIAILTFNRPEAMNALGQLGVDLGAGSAMGTRSRPPAPRSTPTRTSAA